MKSQSNVNLDRRLDTSFGSVFPTEVRAARVIVQPATEERERFYFILLIPGATPEEAWRQKMFDLCADHLHDGDKFTIYEWSDGDEKDWSHHVPLLSFDPEREDEFSWIVPPPHLRS